MKNTAIAILAALAALLAGCQTINEAGPQLIGQADLRHADGANAGTVRIYLSGGETTMAVALIGLEAGKKAVRLSDIDACAAPDPALPIPPPGLHREADKRSASAVTFSERLPDITIGQEGSGMMSVNLAGQTTHVLRKLMDASVLIYEIAEDTDAGTTGDRMELACGVIRPSS